MVTIVCKTMHQNQMQIKILYFILIYGVIVYTLLSSLVNVLGKYIDYN